MQRVAHSISHDGGRHLLGHRRAQHEKTKEVYGNDISSGIERTRGAKESSQQLEVLRQRWPFAFPIKHHDVRPLAASAVGVIAATMPAPALCIAR